MTEQKMLPKKKLLLLVHRIPYPPNKGDKIRSFHLLEELREQFDVHLGCFVDDPADWQWADELRARVAELKLIKLDPRVATIGSARALLQRQALSLPYYRNRQMQRWVDASVKAGCDRVMVFSSTMAQYVEKHSQLTRVADFVDVDSDKWRQYAESKRWPISAIYQRESKRLLAFERKIAASFKATALVTDAEVALFQQLAPESADRIHRVANGVDWRYFDAELSPASPYGNNPVVAFTGAMDYWANADAVIWFAENVWPLVHAKMPDAEFHIVGGKPTAQVQQLADKDGVFVAGRVPDMRPYITGAKVTVASLRIARGVQNKVLESLALEVPVLASEQAAEGLEPGVDESSGLQVLNVNDPAPWVDAVVAALNTNKRYPAGRKYILNAYDWHRNLSQFVQMLL